MKRIIFFSITGIFLFLNLSCVSPGNNEPMQNIGQEPALDVTLTFNRQSGRASNQFAVWIETTEGQHIKTLYATRWTANGGWRRRPTSIPLWVSQSNVAGKTRSEIDAVSGTTPRTGTVNFTWDGTDNTGAPLPAGNFFLVIEGTLRWENQVYYRAPVALGQGASMPNVSVEFIGDTALAERSMISDVVVRVLR